MKISVSLFMNANYKVYDVDMDGLKKAVTSKIHYSNILWKTGYRKTDNYIPESDLLIFDFDAIVTLPMAKEYFKPYEYLIVTTKSHNKLKSGLICDRFRVILPLNYPLFLQPEEYKCLMKYLTNRYNSDTQAVDCARFYYGYSGEVFINNGSRFDWRQYWQYVLDQMEVEKELLEEKRKIFKDSGSSILNPIAWEKAFKPSQILSGERNNRLAKIAFWLRDSGADYSLVLDALNFVNDRICIPLDKREIETIAKTKFRRWLK